MDLTKLLEYCDQNDHAYEKNGEITIITSHRNFTLKNALSIPDNIHFKSQGYVNLVKVKEIPETVIFENVGDVHLKDDIKIPAKYTGFKNGGNLHPENIKYKAPKVTFYTSQEFNMFLDENSGKNDYISKLCDIRGRYPTSEQMDINFLDCSNVDEICFLNNSKLIKFYSNEKKNNPGAYNNFANYVNNNRSFLYDEAKKNSVKIGRFLKKFFTDIKDADVEEIANLYKSFKSDNEYEFEMVKGEVIKQCYYRPNQDTGNGTVLSNSCMNWTKETDTHPHNHRNILKMLDFYTMNPACELLVLRFKNAEPAQPDDEPVVKLKKDGTPDKRYKNTTPSTIRKIRGRAFIWHSKNGETYMEYIYTVRSAEQILYQNYAKERGWVTVENRYDGENMRNKYKSIEIDVPDEIANLEVLPTYLDSLNYDETKKIVKAQ